MQERKNINHARRSSWVGWAGERKTFLLSEIMKKFFLRRKNQHEPSDINRRSFPPSVSMFAWVRGANCRLGLHAATSPGLIQLQFRSSFWRVIWSDICCKSQPAITVHLCERSGSNRTCNSRNPICFQGDFSQFLSPLGFKFFESNERLILWAFLNESETAHVAEAGQRLNTNYYVKKNIPSKLDWNYRSRVIICVKCKRKSNK